MKRFIIMTVGKTHSGKTTFSKALEQQLKNAIVIDQDNHAEFVNSYYRSLRPLQGPNTIKYAITKTIVDYTIQNTNYHIILSNSNLDRRGRAELLHDFHENNFESVLVHFDIPDYILEERVRKSQRSQSIFRTASSFKEVLDRQIAELRNGNIMGPKEGEANHLFIISDPQDIPSVMQSIVILTSDMK
ncbi:ATP-binding protein [Paenibacillus sp. 1001270B_150601_E10]|uniref:ATP-binding protein n=1 Tax=Paenibacillus sp. 1001270B_150601_E10 TaxID=2787079 RepID=UPI0018A03542|nr:ATP-binding protein [Paenibacillus sp. 1001270B_150601_E10]